MITRYIVTLGLLLMTPSAFAIVEGIYQTPNSNLVLEAKVWTTKMTLGSRHIMEIRQIQPPIKLSDAPPIYMFVKHGAQHGLFEYGDLVLPTSPNQGSHGHPFFVNYQEPVSKKRLFQLETQDGKTFVFEYVSDLTRNNRN